MFSIKSAIKRVLDAADSIESVNEVAAEAVSAKSNDIAYFWTNEDGTVSEVSKAEADQRLAEAKTEEEKQLATLPFKSSDLRRICVDKIKAEEGGEEEEEEEEPWEALPSEFMRIGDYKLRILSLHQFATYSGLNEKVPVEADTNRFIYNCIKRAEQAYAERAGSLISLAPVLRTKTYRAPENRPEFTGVVEDVRSELLPAVCSVAHLNNGRFDVVVVWFQDGYGLPTEALREEINKLDIKRVAKEKR